MLRLLLFLLFFGGMIHARANPVQKNKVNGPVQNEIQKLKIDTNSKIELRRFDGQAIKTYSKKREFIYDDTAPSPSLWDRFWNWLWQLMRGVLGSGVGGTIIKYLLVAAVIGIIVFMVLKIMGLDLRVLTGKSKAVEVPFHEGTENIHEIDFDQELEQALRQGNYRLGVRLLYLKTLKLLSDQQLIHWLPEKTNQTYVSEIADAQQQQEFAALTKEFEYIWYGEFFIDQQGFGPIEQLFNQFNQPKR